ncbi:unnamed protein product [Soboliphyme baturini]|uniref:VbhA domain-containing protein n=1 Tax=Soboliphyme baturini TaxID=241478 RepID=A0A183IYJ0_9BILA|nr:unnamed protein product [Soboliphyme baturini]
MLTSCCGNAGDGGEWLSVSEEQKLDPFSKLMQRVSMSYSGIPIHTTCIRQYRRSLEIAYTDAQKQLAFRRLLDELIEGK